MFLHHQPRVSHEKHIDSQGANAYYPLIGAH